MAFVIMSDKFERLCEITSFKSILWHPLYLSPEGGDFKFELPAEKYLPFIKKDYYIINEESKDGKFGIIDTFQVDDTEGDDTTESGSIVTVSGFMGESILKRRVIFPTLSMSGTLDDLVGTIIRRNVTEPANHSRKIENFTYKSNPAFNERVSKQITGANVAKALVSICGQFGHAFVVRFNADYTGFEMEIIDGTDRSAQQLENPVIVFSADDYGLTEFKYLTSNQSVFTHVICAGEGYGEERPSVTYPSYSVPSTTGLNRREVFLDKKDLSRNQGADGQMSASLYLEKLEYEAAEKLQESSTSEACEGVIKPNHYRLYEDFFVGDIVSVQNEKYHMGYHIRVLGALISIDENGAQDITAEMGNLVVVDINDEPEEPEEDVVEEEDEENIPIIYPTIDQPTVSLRSDMRPITFTGCTLQQVNSAGSAGTAAGLPAGWVHVHSNRMVEIVLTASTRYYAAGASAASLGTLKFTLTSSQNSIIGDILAADMSGLVFPVFVIQNGTPTVGTLTLGEVTRALDASGAYSYSCSTTLNIGSPSGAFALLLNGVRAVMIPDQDANPVAYLENPDTIDDDRKSKYWMILKISSNDERVEVYSKSNVTRYSYECCFFDEIPQVGIAYGTDLGRNYVSINSSTYLMGIYLTDHQSATAETNVYNWRRWSADGTLPEYYGYGDITRIEKMTAFEGGEVTFVPYEVVAANFDVYDSTSGSLVLSENAADVGSAR